MTWLGLLRGELWRAADRLRTPAYAEAEFLARAQWWDRAELGDFQSLALRRILSHAAAKVPYYATQDTLKNAVRSGIDSPFEVLRQLPPLERQALREQGANLLSTDSPRRKAFENSSGGSTGVPVRFWQDRQFAATAHAVKLLCDGWAGYRLGEPQVRLWGSDRDLLGGRLPARQLVGRWFRGERWLAAFTLGAEEIQAHLTAMNHVRPTMIVAYAGAIHAVAQYALRTGIGAWTPRAIVTSAGTLTDGMRAVIQEAFQAPVYNRYGSREAGDVAMECGENAGLHIVAPFHYVEVVGPAGAHAAPGEVGEVLLTPLRSWSMPLIRYRTGDLAEVASGECACGRHWPLLRRVTGRIVEAFVLADGGLLMPEAILHLIGVVVRPRWVGQYQVIQKSIANILLRVTVLPGRWEEAEQSADIVRLEAALSRAIGAKCTLEVERVASLEPSPSGKLFVTLTEVARG